ncbi:oligoribonuclease (3'-5' exoribonuclease) [Geomicrobium halophilum]|uniref:Oligoribonuclease (3'-5' exoribonuclease) n=1 Tax=Geomicrobium halophilum TaxID=549000 RepID=A0A841Q140_9BACL|nr:M14 family metallopeptidase [Geomicrobium halophilum]MBB6451572.1 oligoribonuclease (3'-5' exoribonuclease) [Geomicrobium halophilum]
MRSKRSLPYVLMLSITVLMLSTLGSETYTEASSDDYEFERDTAHVRITVPDEKALDELVASDLELIEYVREQEDMLEVDAIVTPNELQELNQQYDVTTIQRRSEAEQVLRERQQNVQQIQTLTEQVDEVNILRAQHFTNQSGTFLYVESKTSAGDAASVALTAEWTDDSGEEHTVTMDRQEDYGEYLYHRMLIDVESVPENVTVSSNQGGSAEASVSEWIGDPPEAGDHYVSDFIDHYMTPNELNERIEQLAAEFPELAEVVTMPNETNGYRRHAQGMIGDPGDNPEAAIVITSNAWGHEGGNNISVTVEIPDNANEDLQVDVNSEHITVNLATDGSANPSSTAAEVIEAINGASEDMVTASSFRSYEGEGIVQPQSEIELNNNLNAPQDVSREPADVKAIRIGKDRDGSQTGVLAYAQEHAREWVTPLVTIETAEQLLRNYHSDPETQELVDNLDIFLVPSINPDGANYSFHDYNWQRKNMANHCDIENSDPYLRDSWGVDLNRNHAVGSVYDGYIGGSTNCTSGTYAGPEPLSEPESENLIWLAEENPNINFAMNIHSHGGYFMWSPGAYDENRNTLPRPTAGEEAYYWEASETILNAIQAYRGTVILPERTGPIPDVLYSAGGNSADALWYDHDIFAWNFEVGAELWNPDEERWESQGFQPPFEEEGHAQGMEFASGLIGMLDVANDYYQNEDPPSSTVSPEEGSYNEPIEVSFETSEPATIYYTLDGSKPTFDSNALQLAGTREGAETLTINATTTMKWFSEDMAGNVENHYDPKGTEENYNEAEFLIAYDVEGMKQLVELFEDEGEIESAEAARALITHLRAVSHYENQEETEKVIEHMEGLKDLLDHQLNEEMMSEYAYDTLYSYTEDVIQQ